MAAQTFSIKLTANGKEVKELMDALKKQANEYEQQLGDINEKLKERDKLTKEEIKVLEQQSNSLAAKIKALGTAVEENVTNLRKVDDVMKNLSGSSGAELGKALRGIGQQMKRVSDQTLKSGETMEQKLTELKEKLVEVRHEMTKREGIDAMKRAQATMQELANTPLDKLRMGLDSIEKKLATMSEAERRAAGGMQLLDARSRYKAQIAVTEQGPADNGRDIAKMNADQLRAEQARLRTAYQTTDGAKGYETVSQEYLTRLQAVNQQLQQMNNVDLNKVFADIDKQPIATLEQALKQVKEQAAQIKVGDETQIKQTAQQIEVLEAKIAEAKQKLGEGIAEALDFDNLQDVPTEKLEQALKQLEQQEKRLIGTDTAGAQKMAENKRKVQEQINRNRRAVQDYANAEKVAANTGKHNVTELKAAYETLQQKLMGLNTSEKEAINTTRQQMAKLKKAINEVNGEATGLTKVWKTAVRNIGAYVGVFAVFNKIKSTLTDLVRKNIEFSDELTNIRKVSQLTEYDINRMAVSLSKIDTRTSVHELNNLAYAGAKLGMGKYGAEGLASFVRAADKVNVALKEDLGDDALTAMSKLVEVMGLIPKMGIEKSMDAAGSAIFMLSTSSTSTGANIIEFSKRLMGLANVSHVTTDELLALGSASDAMGLMPEVAATAFNKVFTSIQTNTKEIAAALGDTNGELQSLIDKGQTMEGIVYVLDKMNSMSVQEMQGRGLFKALGSDGARLNNVITTMADRVDMLKDHLDISNEAFKEGTAVQIEYAMQMESAAGYADRAANVWEKAFVNPEGVDLVKELAVEWYNVSREMTGSASTMTLIKSTLNMLATVIGTIVKLLPVLIRLMMFYGVGAAIQFVYNQVRVLNQALLSASASAGKLNAVLKANAFAFAFSAAMTLATSLYDVATAEDEAKKKADALNTAIAEAEEEYKRSKKSLDEYIEKLNDSSLKEDERRKILRNFNNEYGTYINKLGLETSEVIAQTSAYNALNEELRKNAQYKMIQKLNDSYVGEAENVESAALGRFLSVAQQYGFDATPIIEKRAELGADELLQMVYNQLYNNQLQWSSTNKYQYKRPGSNATYSTSPVDWVATDRTKDIYNAITGLVPASRETKARKDQVQDLVNKYGLSDYDPDEMTLELALSQLDRLSKVSLDNLNKGLAKLRIEWGKLSAEQQQADEQGIKPAMDKYEAQIRKMTYKPGPTDKEIRNAQQDEKQALRKDLQDAQRESDAIIAKIEEWYRLQETVITNMQNDGKLTKEQADQAVRTLNIAKNTALRDARLAVSGRDTKAWEVTKQQIGNLMLDQGQWSQELLQQILDVSMDAIRQNLSRIDKGGGKYGITTSSLKDAVDKNAAGNQREIARLQARSQQEVEKILMEYDYIDQAMRAFSDRLAQMGILTETARQMAERLSEANDVNALFSMRDYDKLLAGNESAKRDMLQAFIATGSTPYAVNPEDTDQLRSWFMDFVGQFATVPGASPLGEGMPNVEYQYQSWAEPFQADFELWLRNSEQYKAQIQAFYFSLMKSEQNYYENRKKQREQDQREAETRWQAYGWTAQQEQENMQYERDSALRKIHGEGQNFGQTYGFADTIADDPEIKRIQNRMEARQRELDDLVAKNAAEEAIMQKQNEMLQEAANLAEKVSQEVANRIAKVQTLSEPLNAFGEEVGQKLGEMWQGISQEGKLTFGEMARNMGIEYAKLTIKMVSENLQKKLQQGIFYKQMEMQEMQHQVQLYNIQQAGAAARATGQLTAGATLQGIQAAQNAAEIGAEGGKATVMTMFGISEGAAKTIAKLGFWGIPLIGVITSILMGLLNSAKATASQSTESTSSSSSATKTKLVSGMLTYNQGNADRVVSGHRRKLYDDGSVQVYDRPDAQRNRSAAASSSLYPGTDGHVYRATPQPALPDGVQLIRKPIATTVNGQPSLVAERGPEIIIGRRATRHIQMNEPGLLHHLAAINGRYRTYDEGTVPVGSPDGAPSLSGMSGGEADARVAAALEQNTQMMLAMQQTIAALSQTVTTLQQRGIPAHIQKYGTGGLIDEVKSGLKFDQRYNR